MDTHQERRAGLRTLWIAQGLAIAALTAGPGIAAASNVHLTPRSTLINRPDIVVSTDVPPDPVNVPEPGTLALMLAGFGGLLFAQARRRANRCSTSDETR